jgi:hypothetical protein
MTPAIARRRPSLITTIHTAIGSMCMDRRVPWWRHRMGTPGLSPSGKSLSTRNRSTLARLRCKLLSPLLKGIFMSMTITLGQAGAYRDSLSISRSSLDGTSCLWSIVAMSTRMKCMSKRI